MDAKALETYLSKHPAFKDLSPEHTAIVAKYASAQQFKAGVLIFNQDEPADQFFMITEGKVTVEIPALYGAPVIIETLGSGEVLGWSWLFPPYKWHFAARAAEDTTTFQIDGKRLRQECDQDPVLGYAVVMCVAKFMMERLSASRQRVMDLFGPDS